ncbi:MAG: hypothetical protein JXA89_22030 [Anaerolineae bacterium]|nr:hypothetical protein [Anaerolineae bacterium]
MFNEKTVPHIWPILIYQAFVIIVLGMVIWIESRIDHPSWHWMAASCAAYGGIGSAGGAIFCLYKKPKQNKIGYYLDPLIGFLTGVVLYWGNFVPTWPGEAKEQLDIGYGLAFAAGIYTSLCNVGIRVIRLLAQDRRQDSNELLAERNQAQPEQKQKSSTAAMVVGAILAYAVLWSIVLGIILTLDINPFPYDIRDQWDILVWGCVGGTLLIFYGIIKHGIWKRDFSKDYIMWYIAQPVIAGMLGAFIYYLGRHFQITSILVEMYAAQGLACLVGFRQEYVLKAIDLVIRLLTPEPTKGQTL